ncbi:hypothetical protein [Rhizobium sp. MHM7A]|uniref:hypothetical protein n=1 Tax=Rhizobium sp. MHM7A TaxID=2583233 RepID=UPI0011074648|nr:hypothetical protein [Rhizobium sp. MHM7A]TLX17253.1 hypothetical protein FFR93_08120 [Rhizobium sp. MHM7A]
MTHEERATIMATINGWHIDQDDNFARALDDAAPDVITNIAPTDVGAWGMLCDMEGIEVPDFIDQKTVDKANEMGNPFMQSAQPRM